MTQFIQSTPGTLAAAMQQSGQPNPYTQGQLALANGGLASIRRGYMGGGAIGGGIIQGIPMSGGRTGFGLLSKAKKRLKKLIPKELAPIAMAASPFLGPVAGPIAAGLGSYKHYGKINPRVMAMSVLPHLTFGGSSPVGYGNWGSEGGNSIRRLLTGEGKGSAGGILNIGKGNPGFGTKLDEMIFGSSQGPRSKKGIFNTGGDTIDIIDVLKTVTGGEGASMKKRAGNAYAIFNASETYVDYRNAMDEAGMPPEMTMSNDDYDKAKLTFKEWEGMGNAMGGIPRTRHAMGSPQFPPNRRVYADGGRTGLRWGSDNGEGLGGEEVEADMRYEGGFMPYGEEPKADDVPARLSKDEFVFTDQAVAGAGDGDVELGAERLYNVMKNLESGGKLSEESEGNMGEGIGGII